MAAIESILTETRVFPPADDFVRQANVSGMDAYQALCSQAETDYEGFWADLARQHIAWNPGTERLAQHLRSKNDADAVRTDYAHGIKVTAQIRVLLYQIEGVRAQLRNG